MPNYVSKSYYTDYFTDVIHPCIHSLQSKAFQFIKNYFCIHQADIGNIIRNFKNYNMINYYENEIVTTEGNNLEH